MKEKDRKRFFQIAEEIDPLLPTKKRISLSRAVSPTTSITNKRKSIDKQHISNNTTFALFSPEEYNKEIALFSVEEKYKNESDDKRE
eukprot:Pgem_evm1s13086